MPKPTSEAWVGGLIKRVANRVAVAKLQTSTVVCQSDSPSWWRPFDVCGLEGGDVEYGESDSSNIAG